MAKRLTPAARARNERIDRLSAEVMQRHPKADEVIVSWFGTELYLDAWQKGRGGIARYVDVIDDLEAAFTAPANP